MPLIMSAAPAATRHSNATTSDGANPNAMIAKPHNVAATTTARPCLCTLRVQPLVAENKNDPTAMAA